MNNQLRPVRFRMWKKPMYETPNGPSEVRQYGQQPIEGTGVFTDMVVEGSFHSFGYEGVDNGESMIQETRAIIEDRDGYIHMTEPHNFKFETPLI